MKMIWLKANNVTLRFHVKKRTYTKENKHRAAQIGHKVIEGVKRSGITEN